MNPMALNFQQSKSYPGSFGFSLAGLREIEKVISANVAGPLNINLRFADGNNVQVDSFNAIESNVFIKKFKLRSILIDFRSQGNGEISIVNFKIGNSQYAGQSLDLDVSGDEFKVKNLIMQIDIIMNYMKTSYHFYGYLTEKHQFYISVIPIILIIKFIMNLFDDSRIKFIILFAIGIAMTAAFHYSFRLISFVFPRCYFKFGESERFQNSIFGFARWAFASSVVLGIVGLIFMRYR